MHGIDRSRNKRFFCGGTTRANAVPPEQIASAEEQLKTGLQQALGPERYVDYQMATSDTGQQMNSLSIRYDLPKETIREAFSLLTQLDQLAKRIPQSSSPDTSGLQIRQTELEQELQQTLDPHVWQAWINERNQRYDLQP